MEGVTECRGVVTWQSPDWLHPLLSSLPSLSTSSHPVIEATPPGQSLQFSYMTSSLVGGSFRKMAPGLWNGGPRRLEGPRAKLDD